MFERLLRKKVNQQREQGAHALPYADPAGSERRLSNKDVSQPLDREQVVEVIGRHDQKLADLANEQGCTTLYDFLRRA
jgi:hypothetical protein